MRYDYIVVGGGTAGCIVACRILEARLGSVLVLEAGSYPVGRKLHVPALYQSALNSKWDWSDRSSPQPKMMNRTIVMPRGRTLGGCSQINAMIYCQGHPSDFDAWQSLGIQTWSSESCQPYFERSRIIDPLNASESNLSTQRRLPLSQPGIQFNSSNRFLEASRELGWNTSNEATMDSTVGCRPYMRTQWRGRRTNPWTALLRPFLDDRDSMVQVEATVHRIELKGNRAHRVHLEHRGSRQEVVADRGIILTAGAFQSPALLLRSGIGCREELSEVGVDSVMDLPCVGHHLQDHLVFPIVYSVPASDSPSRLSQNLQARQQYIQERSGPLASNLAEVGAFGTLQSGCCSKGSIDFPEFQVHMTPNHYLEYATRDDPKPAMSLGVTWLRPASLGRVQLVRHADSLEPPVQIDPKYLSDESDVQNLVDAIKVVRQLGQSQAFAQSACHEIFPGPDIDSDELLAKRIRRLATTIYHPVGTCRIGSPNSGVVDEQLQVHGIDRLFVADSSVIPVLPTGNTQAATMMIAERCVDFLKVKVE